MTQLGSKANEKNLSRWTCRAVASSANHIVACGSGHHCVILSEIQKDPEQVRTFIEEILYDSGISHWRKSKWTRSRSKYWEISAGQDILGNHPQAETHWGITRRLTYPILGNYLRAKMCGKLSTGHNMRNYLQAHVLKIACGLKEINMDILLDLEGPGTSYTELWMSYPNMSYTELWMSYPNMSYTEL